MAHAQLAAAHAAANVPRRKTQTTATATTASVAERGPTSRPADVIARQQQLLDRTRSSRVVSVLPHARR